MKRSVPLIIGNWKLNPITLSDAAYLASAVARKHKTTPEPYVAIAPPFPYLAEVGKKIAKSAVALAAQDVHYEPIGPFTGEVSAAQLKDLGATFVIIGHSERRAMGESDAVVRKKVQAVLKHRLTPIVCVGERERDEQGNFFGFVEAQLRSLAEVLPAAVMKKVVIAYEPIWAIGTGNTATVDDVKEMQLFIETVLTKLYDRPTAKAVRLLYGGSVKPGNAAALHAEGDMNGFLVGGASLKADDFAAIINAVS
ncbi:triose-phosphate isomerase [Candidatus Kaiserbacteria bacterium]|nr:triose-phosphate isomerase [Candidatus Kaiserbacteria bacterium]MCB9812318.1 triose-phosphate isomerase [Candidatus Nomurabacteria bacterium]